MPSDPRDQIDRLRSQLEDGERGGCPADRELLLEFSDETFLVPSKCGDHRHLKTLRHGVRLSEEPGVDLVDVVEDEAAAKEAVRWIHRTYENEHTNQDYRTALRTVGRRATAGDEVPGPLAWVPTGTSNDFDPVPSERDLLDREQDVQPMIEAAQNPRDAALIAVQFEAGLRGGELYDLRVGDVFDGDHAVGLHVDGKQGERSVHLIESVSYLQRWLQAHPGREDDAYLWTKLGTAERVSYQMLLKIFREVAGRVGISKEVTPTNFRKSNTRWLLQVGFETPRIEDRQGRKRGSEQTARYLARFGDESTEVAFAKAMGRDVDGEGDDEFGPIVCHRCDRETPRHEDFCVWCNAALDHDAAARVDELEDDMFADAADADGRELDDLQEARRLLREHPALKRALLGE
ncbi:integrase [Halarchaeum rubridurum]|uniref:Integrase n=1 Tax=Halarchaeum rubridurum TaxID=489911 RepID=A0A830FN95_9EURY|nr:tyrosine-type recombinase/integrase [Halarchaeum rubridurum]MBP1953621.1 integrase [Halarchaeum rubridurum]GGM63875.1 hypothetical protein GCM10009017_12430 [Halarchaeum rubridurum]